MVLESCGEIMKPFLCKSPHITLQNLFLNMLSLPSEKRLPSNHDDAIKISRAHQQNHFIDLFTISDEMIVMQARPIFPRSPVKSIRGIIRKTPGHQPGQGVLAACKISARP